MPSNSSRDLAQDKGKILVPESSLFMNRSVNHENDFIELYNQYSDDIFRFCLLRLRDRDRALDATAEIFFKLWNEYAKNPEKWAEIGNIRAYMFRIARNTVIDMTRKKISTPFSSLIKTSDDSSGESHLEPVPFKSTGLNPEEEQSFSELIDNLNLLDTHHHELLVYKFIHDMSIPDIARILNISENATSVRIHRALEHARKKLGHLYHYE